MTTVSYLFIDESNDQSNIDSAKKCSFRNLRYQFDIYSYFGFVPRLRFYKKISIRKTMYDILAKKYRPGGNIYNQIKKDFHKHLNEK